MILKKIKHCSGCDANICTQCPTGQIDKIKEHRKKIENLRKRIKISK